MRGVLVVLVLAAFLQSGAALRCFQCIGSLTGECFNAVIPGMLDVECDYTTMDLPESLKHARADEIDTKCVSLVTNLLGMTFMERGCGYIYRDVDICKFMIEVQGLNLDRCSYCNTTLCNTVVFT